MARIGLQLYTVRDACERDFEATLRAVAGAGYEGVELHELWGHAPDKVSAWLAELGLVACGRHVRLDLVETELAALAAEARSIGFERLVVSWLPPDEIRADPDGAADRVAAAARQVEDRGLSLGYHNHDAEVSPLADGATFLDLLLDRGVFLEPDIGWAWWAGADPERLLERAHGRCPLVHVKDFGARGGADCELGRGAIEYARIVPAAVAAGAEWLVVEQDEPERPSVQAAVRSLAALRRLL